jgi:hypothetical protein
MPERIMRAVANPPTLFWAPQYPAMINLGLHAVGIIFGWAMFQITPLPIIASAVGIHIIIAAQGAKEPHLSTWLKAWAEGMKPTKNIVKGKTKKYVP